MPSYSGVWTLVAQMQAEAAGNWPKRPPIQELFAWGSSFNGALGLGNTQSVSSPVQIGALTTWAQVSSAGDAGGAAIKNDNTLWRWGQNNRGQLGLNDTANRSSPVQVGALTNWKEVNALNLMCVAVKTDGTLWAWGTNGQGQLGLNDTGNYRSSPTQVGTLTGWNSVATGNGSLNCGAIKIDGTMWMWGDGSTGALGQNNTISQSSPVQVGALTTWASVSINSHCVAIKTDGTMWSWGYNGQGQLGHNNTTSRSSPVQIGALTTWAQARAGLSNCAAIKIDGTLWVWGQNTSGVLGINSGLNHSSPVQVGALTTWASVSINKNTCVAIKTDGTLWAWGVNSSGQLGFSDTVDRSSPVQVGVLSTWATANTGSSTFAITNS